MMRELYAVAEVDEHGELELHLHTDLPPGRHPLTLLLADAPAANGAHDLDDLPSVSVGAVLPAFSMDREDLYRDGRL